MISPDRPIETGFRLVVAVDEVVAPLISETQNGDEHEIGQTEAQPRKRKQRNGNRERKHPEQSLPWYEDQRNVARVDVVTSDVRAQAAGRWCSLPTRLGRQCRMNTWMTHSKNGNSASITTGTSASVICQSPTTMRAAAAAASVAPIIHGEGCFQNSHHASQSVKPLRAVRSVRDGHGCSSSPVITASIAVVAGSRRSSAACFAASGSPATIASARPR